MKSWFWIFLNGIFIFFPIFSFALDKKQIALTEKNLIYIKPGLSVNKVAVLLQEKKVIKSSFFFKLLVRLKSAGAKIKSGEYIFPKNSSLSQVLDILIKGKVYLHKITFPEGYNIYEMAGLLEQKKLASKKEFISLCHNLQFIHLLLKKPYDSLEGYLFPDTYYVARPLNLKQFIQKMVKNFLSVYETLSKNQTAPIKLDRHKQVILASIVEKESGKESEKNMIAGVFYNRLKKKMRLESDPTTLYGMMKEKGGLVKLNIRKKDLLKKNAYNTYKISGFPKGPISNPGKKALMAVFQPKKNPFLFFVSRNDGSHVFSKTYKEHKKAVNFYQKKIR